MLWESFREVARSYGVELVIENAVGPSNVNADREAIHQIFSNLIENALKYAASGKKVILGARAAESGVEFYVRDFGPGISSEHLPRLFERFYRVDKARSRESGGTGLGLAIAKHIVLAHGGTIRAESELNHGSSFLFTLTAPEQLPSLLKNSSFVSGHRFVQESATIPLREVVTMPQYVIEREIPGAGELSDAELQAVARKSVGVLKDMGPEIKWLHSYVTGDKIYCVYLAPDEETIREHARRGGFPANRIAAVRRLIDPDTAH
jgi:anti-sigma regulatory factor (Ser/Thr protein kinase)